MQRLWRRRHSLRLTVAVLVLCWCVLVCWCVGVTAADIDDSDSGSDPCPPDEVEDETALSGELHDAEAECEHSTVRRSGTQRRARPFFHAAPFPLCCCMVCRCYIVFDRCLA